MWALFFIDALAWYNTSVRRQDMLSVLITFTVGFIGGGFLYVTHFAKLIQPLDSIPTANQAEAFTIIGEAYGSCESVCPSFRVTNDGSYRYQFYTSADGEKQFRDGTLPAEITRDLKQDLKASVLEKQSVAVEPEDCNSYNDGIDISYSITLDGDEFTLDSCGTAVDGNGDAWSSLAKIWSYFQTLD
jgi:hypothetical protein